MQGSVRFALPFFAISLSFLSFSARADENLFGYVKGAETLPAGSSEMYQIFTSRNDKSVGEYRALDSETEIEYGFTDRFTAAAAFRMQSINTKGLLINAYIPKDESYGLRPSGFEIAGKYNFLSAAKDDIGFSTSIALDHSWLDSHSGQNKSTTSVELNFLLQKYFLEGEMIWVTNFGMESTHARRAALQDLPTAFEWPAVAEMEIELKAGTGLSYRFAPQWFIGGETLYETEYETEVDQERWTIFAGPSLHYGSQNWWTTITGLKQISGGGEMFDGQPEKLHLIEKTKQEIRLKVGYNF